MLRFILIKISHPLWLWQVLPVFFIAFFSYSVTYAAVLTQDQLLLNDNLPAATSNYLLSFDIANSETLGSVDVQFCSNSPLVTMSCSAPIGFSDSSSTLTSQSGTSGFSISSLSDANTLILTRTPVTQNSGPVSFNFSNVLNPSSDGSYYVRIQTYASADASGSSEDIGGIAYSINSPFNIQTYVPPYLLFCSGVTIPQYNCANANGSIINFGYLSSAQTSTAASQLLVATNAKNGYSVELSGNSMTSGNNVIPPLNSDSASQPGQNQFGLNLVANNQPTVGSYAQGPGTGLPTSSYANPNLFSFNPGSVIASSTQPSDYRQYTISYIINISNSQPPGVYATTLSYIALGNF